MRTTIVENFFDLKALFTNVRTIALNHEGNISPVSDSCQVINNHQIIFELNSFHFEEPLFVNLLNTVNGCNRGVITLFSKNGEKRVFMKKNPDNSISIRHADHSTESDFGYIHLNKTS